MLVAAVKSRERDKQRWVRKGVRTLFLDQSRKGLVRRAARRPDGREERGGQGTPRAEHGGGERHRVRDDHADRGIVDAILAGNALAAEDAARRHLDAVWYRLAELGESGSLPNSPLERACTYLELHLAEPVSLVFLAEHVARTSPGHLARLFRERGRVSFTGYVQQLRLHRAVGLLTATREPIQRVATLVGYSDPSRFAAHFRRHYGLTPRAYRDRFRGPQAAAPDA